MTAPLRRRWHVVAWKLPLFVAVLILSCLLEGITSATWHAYIWADNVRDRFQSWWRGVRCDLPSWWTPAGNLRP